MSSCVSMLRNDVDQFYGHVMGCPGCFMAISAALPRLERAFDDPLMQLLPNVKEARMVIEHAKSSLAMCLIKFIESGDILAEPSDNGDFVLNLSPHAKCCGDADAPDPACERATGDSGTPRDGESIRSFHDDIIAKVAGQFGSCDKRAPDRT